MTFLNSSQIHNHNESIHWDIRTVNLSIQFLMEELEKGNISDIEFQTQYHLLMQEIAALQDELI